MGDEKKIEKTSTPNPAKEIKAPSLPTKHTRDDVRNSHISQSKEGEK